MRIRFIFILSFLLSLALTPVFRKIALRWKIFDIPDTDKMHKIPMPLLGGAAVYISFMIPVLFIGKSQYLAGLALAGTIIFLTGLIDDIKKLPALFRLLIQFIAAVIVMSSGIMLSFLPNTFCGNMGEAILTIIWIIGITNAINYLDGIDGLLASLAIITGLCFLVIAHPTDQFILGCMSSAIMGSSLGFLRYNSPPARIFLGDSGSTFIGFMLASIAIMGNWAEDNFVSIFVPVFILGVPIFDMTLTTIMRIKEKKVRNLRDWLAFRGKDHFHHRLLDLGFGPRSAVMFIAAISLCVGISGILLKNESLPAAVFMLLQAAAIFVLIGILMVVAARKKIEDV